MVLVQLGHGAAEAASHVEDALPGRRLGEPQEPPGHGVAGGPEVVGGQRGRAGVVPEAPVHVLPEDLGHDRIPVAGQLVRQLVEIGEVAARGPAHGRGMDREDTVSGPRWQRGRTDRRTRMIRLQAAAGLHAPMTVQELVTRWPLSPAFGSAAAVESGESWNGVAGPREWAFLLLSLAGLLWALPPLTWPLSAVTFVAVYAVGVSGLRRSLRLVLVLALLVGFLALERALPRPQVPLVLWSGRTIRAFFLLRAIDFVHTRPRRELSARPAHRVFQFLLFVTFFPCLFAGPVVLFNDFYRAYRPGSFAARSALLRNTGTIAWGALKFYALG